MPSEYLYLRIPGRGTCVTIIIIIINVIKMHVNKMYVHIVHVCVKMYAWSSV